MRLRLALTLAILALAALVLWTARDLHTTAHRTALEEVSGDL